MLTDQVLVELSLHHKPYQAVVNVLVSGPRKLLDVLPRALKLLGISEIEGIRSVLHALPVRIVPHLKEQLCPVHLVVVRLTFLSHILYQWAKPKPDDGVILWHIEEDVLDAGDSGLDFIQTFTNGCLCLPPITFNPFDLEFNDVELCLMAIEDCHLEILSVELLACTVLPPIADVRL